MVASKALTFGAFASIAALAAAKDIPDNLNTFLQRVKNSECANQVAGPFQSTDGGDQNVYYCQDPQTNAVYIKTAGSSDFTNMDIDCDGDRSGPADDGRCHGDNDDGNQSDTSFEDELSDFGISNLNPYVHSYVVFGADGTDPSFDPTSLGIQHLSTMAVVCNGSVYYGVWGDTNGDDPPVVGEVSLSLATLCYGTDMNDAAGYDGNDVLYIAFPGDADETNVGTAGDWKADNPNDFQSSLEAVGDKLVAKLS